LADDTRITRLIDLLEFEINKYSSEEKRPGWNTWALLIGFGTVCWLGLADLEKNALDTNRVLLSSVFFFLTLESVQFFISSFSSRRSVGDLPRFVITKGYFAQPRLQLLIKAIQYAGLLAITSSNLLIYTGLTKYATYVVCISVIVLVLLGLGLSLAEFPISMAPTFKYSILLEAILIVVFAGITAGFGIMTFAWKPTFPEIRVSILAIVGITCLCLLSQSHQQPPLLSTLTDLRRKLGLDDISYNEAKRQAQIAFEGLGVSCLWKSF
jgi:hypothetical protein